MRIREPFEVQVVFVVESMGIVLRVELHLFHKDICSGAGAAWNALDAKEREADALWRLGTTGAVFPPVDLIVQRRAFCGRRFELPRRLREPVAVRHCNACRHIAGLASVSAKECRLRDAGSAFPPDLKIGVALDRLLQELVW